MAIEWLLQPLQYAFIVRALLAAVMVGIVCPVIGVYIVLRGMAFLGDALAHIILPGVVVAYLLGWPLALGALIMGTVAAVGIGALTERRVLKEDTAIGVILAGLFALGVAMLSATGNYAVDLTHFLFGNLLGVTLTDLRITFLLATFVLLTIVLFFKEFMVISFDPMLAITLRLPERFLRYLLLILIAVTIVISLQVVGVALMLAMLVTPAAAASLLTRRLHSMMVWAVGIGIFSGVTGVYLSFYLDIASGPAVVLVATAVFILTFLFAPHRGMVWQRA
ncbi:MAG: metal ABC transporter permease [Chloroflexi bacterium]|nr:metal ABC transporter permease [Ardenticatenaceae bacterium]MBL1126907.1 metal ABC transporter permease [Chloroflexota bacterium]NOG32963.1 metal ABC transporter permease [Chloroflexota bacterium]GIK54738.1 MAG: membrane protein [Chloroflexota bacterium]